ncbi:tetratricopeptide repeat protein [Streptomyces sp. AC555_RSS877]|uniref:tetratricopeptide repeat protein n=1 Tax=Streptomyces sp. AC555_RSS877 TaxID=2823688 RepID=UPI001C278CB7|nr:tetratricopeptide repeat protein [Streptomyces sp. AC555_RSS877]
MAVTGYCGPAPGTDDAPDAPVRLSRTGDATATEGGLAISGYVGTLTIQQRPPQEPVPWPHQVGLIPPAARAYQHRAEADRLRTTFDGASTAVPPQMLTGMGGVGKTQMAASYARTAWNDVGTAGGLDVLVWITASARSLIVTGYAQAGVELCRADPNDAEKAARSFLAWLTSKAAAKPCRWLIVLDDVTDPADLKGLWPPVSPHGRTLVTTRRRDAALAAHGRPTIAVGLFTEDEALTYLTSSLTGRNESGDQLAALAGDLGYLPLALAQAAAYLIDTGETVADYRHLLADRTTTLPDTAPDALPDDQVSPLAAAWSLSIDRADALRPAGLARPMLQLTSLLAANGIPKDVLTSQPVLAHLNEHRTPTGPDRAEKPGPVSPRDAEHALSALHRLSLIEYTPTTTRQTVRVHQLIQRATRDTLTHRQHDQTAHTAADALLATWPDTERDTALAQTLRANTTALVAHAEDALHRPAAHAVLYRVGTSLGEAGKVAAARDHYRHLTDTTTSHLGPDHTDTLTTRGNLALWRGEAGDAAGAADEFAQLLEHVVRVLGEDHAVTLTTRHNLARWRGEAGDAATAAANLAELLPDQLRILGADHTDTLTTRHNLARWRGRAGDAATAAANLAELLPDQLRILGADHTDTLTTRGYLAFWRGRAGDVASAAAGLAELLPDQVRVLGEDNPNTLITRGNLAQWRGEAGDSATATADLAELLEHKKRVLGPDHPHTLATRQMLAFWRRRAGEGGSASDSDWS